MTLLFALALFVALPCRAQAQAQPPGSPDTVAVHSGSLTLHALLWRPRGPGPFPAVLFNHGSYSSPDMITPDEPAAVGPLFAQHGYVFLFLYRRGVGLSADLDSADGDLMASAGQAEGQEGRNRVQLELLDHEALNEAVAGLAYLRTVPRVDPHRMAVVGHSFGGAISLVLAAQDTTLRAAVSFAGAARSWTGSAQLQARLRSAVDRIAAPVFFIHAANDYSVAPGQQLAAEMRRLNKTQQLKIYSPVGPNSRIAHDFVYVRVEDWEHDVFNFLDKYCARQAGRSN
jgi:carboxymethylenebutenolidase